MFDLNDLRYFLSVAQTGSLSGAARKLGVTHATVSRRIGALEKSLDARLLERTAHGYSLTPAGKEILPVAEEVEQRAWLIEKAVGGDEDRRSGVVRLTTSAGLGNCWLAGKLKAFEASNPEIRLEIVIQTQLLDLLRREADVALRVGSPGSDELIGRRLGKVSCGLYASSEYLDEYGEPRSLEDLTHHFVLESIGPIADLPQAQILRKYLKRSSVALSLDSLMSMLSAARSGIGIAPLPSYMVGEAPELRRLLAKDFDVRLDLWMLTHQDLRNSTRVRAVREFLIDSIESDSTLLSRVSA